MTKRDAVYAAFLGFIAIGVLIDWYIWRGALPPFSLNDIVQMIGILLLTAWWQIEDATMHGYERGRAARILTIVFVPVGLAIYLFQTRPWSRAGAIFIGYLGGAVVAVIAADLLGGALFG